MDKKKPRSVLPYNNRNSSIFSPSKGNQKLYPQKVLLEQGLSKLFSKEPSHLGYRGDIENLLNDLGITDDEFLLITISCLGKIVRNKKDTNIIASYLCSMPNLIKLIKGRNIDKTEHEIMKKLLNLSHSITYQKYSANHILMRLGEIGTTAYIILKGSADVLIKNFKVMNINKFGYLFYLATLIRYGEYGLLNEVINTNYNAFPVEVDFTENNNNNDDNDINNSLKIIKNKIENNFSETNVNNSMNNINNIKFEKRNNTEQGLNENSQTKKSINMVVKLSEKNQEIKTYKKSLIISEQKLLGMFNLKKISPKHLHCSCSEYINRLNISPDDYKKHFNADYMPLLNTKEKDKDKEKDDNETIYFLKIFNYIKVVSLGKGTLFGELALTQENSLRTGTIITSKECDITVLNKKTFNNCLKKGTEVYIRKLLSFFVELPLFSGISEYIFYNKYYTYLSKKIMSRGNILVNQGEAPIGIILLQSGSYGISTKMSLDNLTKLILFYIKSNLNSIKSNNNYEEKEKYHKLLIKIYKMIYQADSLVNENPKFKRFYTSDMNIRINELSSPDIIGFKEYTNEDNKYSFTIETHSPENIYYILDHKFYKEILRKNYLIMKNEKSFSEKKIDVIIQRLMILRNCFVNLFFGDKTEKQISSVISKELDIYNDSLIKQKSLVKNKISEYNFINKEKETKGLNYIKIQGRNNNFRFARYLKHINNNNNNNSETNKNNLSKSKNIKNNNNSINNTINSHGLNLNNRNNKIYKKMSNNYKSRFNLHKSSSISYLNQTSKNFFNKTAKNKFIFKLKQKDNNNMAKESYTVFNKTLSEYFTKKKLNEKRLDSNGVLLNNMVLEEISKSLKLTEDDNKRYYSPFNSNIYDRTYIRYNRYPFIKKSSSDFNNIRIKSKLMRHISNKKNNSIENNNNKGIKITLNVKRIFSPLETHINKNNENSKDKKRFKFRFYHNSIKNKISKFYNNNNNSEKK